MALSPGQMVRYDGESTLSHLPAAYGAVVRDDDGDPYMVVQFPEHGNVTQYIPRENVTTVPLYAVGRYEALDAAAHILRLIANGESEYVDDYSDEYLEHVARTLDAINQE